MFPVRLIVNPSRVGCEGLWCHCDGRETGASARNGYTVFTIVPRQYCSRDTTPGRDQAQSPYSLVWRTVVEESCPSLADSGATWEALSKLTRQRKSQLTSSKRPSTLNYHAGIPWPVSKFGASAVPDRGVSDCHDCPEDVWDRKRRSVRMVWA